MSDLQHACCVLGGDGIKDTSANDSKLTEIEAAQLILAMTNSVGAHPCTFDRIDCSPERVAALNVPIKTGFVTMDMMFGCDGLPSHRVIEISGCSGSGRSTLCMATAISAAILENKRVCYLDTSNVVTTSTIKDYLMQASSCSLGIKKANVKWANVSQDYISRLDNLTICSVSNIWSVLSTLSQLASQFKPPAELLIIDCLSNVLSPLEGIGTTSSLVTHLMLQLRSFADRGSVVIITTNTNTSTSSAGTTTTRYLRPLPTNDTCFGVHKSNLDAEMPEAVAYFNNKPFGTVLMQTVDISMICSSSMTTNTTATVVDDVVHELLIRLDVKVRPPYYAALALSCSIVRSSMFSNSNHHSQSIYM